MAEETWRVILSTESESSGSTSAQSTGAGGAQQATGDVQQQKQVWRDAGTMLGQLVGSAAVIASVFHLIKNSRIFTAFFNAFIDIISAIVDIMLIPMIPIFLPFLRLALSFIPIAWEVSKSLMPFMDKIGKGFEALFKGEGPEELFKAVTSFVNSWLVPAVQTLFGTIIPNIIKELPRFFELAINAFKSVWPSILKSLSELWELIVKVVPQLWDLIGKSLGDLWKIIEPEVKKAWDFASTEAGKFWNDKLLPIVEPWWKYLMGILDTLFKNELLTPLANEMVSFFSKLPEIIKWIITGGKEVKGIGVNAPWNMKEGENLLELKYSEPTKFPYTPEWKRGTEKYPEMPSNTINLFGSVTIAADYDKEYVNGKSWNQLLEESVMNYR